MEQPEAMGAAIRAARSARGLSQRALADLLGAFGLKWPPQTLQRIEVGDAKGYRSVTVTELLLLAAALNYSPDVLALPGDEDEVLALSDTYAVPARQARRWWSGHTHAPGPPLPPMSFPDGVPSPEQAETLRGVARRRVEWEATRPDSELRRRQSEGLSDVYRQAELLVTSALEAMDETRGSTDQREMARAQAARAAMFLIAAARRVLVQDLGFTDQVPPETVLQDIRRAEHRGLVSRLGLEPIDLDDSLEQEDDS